MVNSVELEKKSFSVVLDEVMQNPNYLVGMEPEGSGWDFRNWDKKDFREVNKGSWVLGQKDFSIQTANNNESLAMRIVCFDPSKTELRKKGIHVSYLIKSIFRTSLPTIIVANDDNGNEMILSQKTNVDVKDFIEYYFKNIKTNVVGISDKNDMEWANFLKDVLSSKQFLPADYPLLDDAVRIELYIEEDEEIKEDDRLYAEAICTQQEMLSQLYADYIVEK